MKKIHHSIIIASIFMLQSPSSHAAFSFGKPRQQLDLVGGIQGQQSIVCRDNTVGINPIINQSIPIPSDSPNWTAQIKLYANSDDARTGYFTYSETNLVTNRTTNYFMADKNYSGTWSSALAGNKRILKFNLYSAWQNNAKTSPPTIPGVYPLNLPPLSAVLKGRSANYPICGSTSKKPCFTSRTFSFTVSQSKDKLAPSEITQGNFVGTVLSSVEPLNLEYQNVIADGLYNCAGKVSTNLIMKGTWDGSLW